MARKAKKSSEKEATPKTQPVAVETAETTPTVPEAPESPETSENQEAPKKKPDLIVYKYIGNKYYVYIQGVPPKQNVGCPCNTPLSAMKYMFLLKKERKAVISQKCLKELKAKNKGA